MISLTAAEFADSMILIIMILTGISDLDWVCMELIHICTDPTILITGIGIHGFMTPGTGIHGVHGIPGDITTVIMVAITEIMPTGAVVGTTHTGDIQHTITVVATGHIMKETITTAIAEPEDQIHFIVAEVLPVPEFLKTEEQPLVIY